MLATRHRSGLAHATALLVALATLPHTSIAAPPTLDSPASLRVEVVASYPHDPSAFTQGLVLTADGTLYESTGLEGRSSVRQVDLTTGKVLRKIDLPLPYFGEGLALADGKLIQLTWKHGTAFVYDAFSFSERSRFAYPGEGWGLATQGSTLVMSDGSDELQFRDATTFEENRRIRVTRAGQPLRRLNELEWVEGSIYANIWMTQSIAVIDATSGRVTAIVDAAKLLTPEEASRADVLNGIAYDARSGDFLITGKLWPKMFRVRFVPK